MCVSPNTPDDRSNQNESDNENCEVVVFRKAALEEKVLTVTATTLKLLDLVSGNVTKRTCPARYAICFTQGFHVCFP